LRQESQPLLWSSEVCDAMSKTGAKRERRPSVETPPKVPQCEPPATEGSAPSTMAIETRIDAAHLIHSRRPEKQEDTPPPPTGVNSGERDLAEPRTHDQVLVGQMHRQADQLAMRLRARQEELDHREARVNARVAQLESDAAAARLWLRERVVHLNEREATIASREAQFDTQTRESSGNVSAREEALVQMAETLKSQQQEIEQSETRLTDAQAEIQRLRDELSTMRSHLLQENQRYRAEVEAEQARQTADLETRQAAVTRRAEEVEKSRAALERLRGELGRMHRDTLEVRLATEELWAQLSGDAPPAALTRSLGKIRTQLADHYRQANAELKQQKDELQEIHDRLAEQYDNVVTHKARFERWMESRRGEVDQQAARLVDREEQLDQQETKLAEKENLWQAERFAFEKEIRRLRAELNRRRQIDMLNAVDGPESMPIASKKP